MGFPQLPLCQLCLGRLTRAAHCCPSTRTYGGSPQDGALSRGCCPNTTSVPLDWQHGVRTGAQHQLTQQAPAEGAVTPKGELCSIGHWLPF